MRPCRGNRGAAAALPCPGSGDGTPPNAVSSRFSAVASVSPVCSKYIPAAPGLVKLPAFYLAAAAITQQCVGRNNLCRPSSIAAFLVPRSQGLLCPSPWHSIPTRSQGCGREGAALAWVRWFSPTGHPFMQEGSQGLRIKYIY